MSYTSNFDVSSSSSSSWPSVEVSAVHRLRQHLFDTASSGTQADINEFAGSSVLSPDQNFFLSVINAPPFVPHTASSGSQTIESEQDPEAQAVALPLAASSPLQPDHAGFGSERRDVFNVGSKHSDVDLGGVYTLSKRGTKLIPPVSIMQDEGTDSLQVVKCHSVIVTGAAAPLQQCNGEYTFVGARCGRNGGQIAPTWLNVDGAVIFFHKGWKLDIGTKSCSSLPPQKGDRVHKKTSALIFRRSQTVVVVGENNDFRLDTGDGLSEWLSCDEYEYAELCYTEGFCFHTDRWTSHGIARLLPPEGEWVSRAGNASICVVKKISGEVRRHLRRFKYERKRPVGRMETIIEP
mmetsp:Transcript_115339/g.229903  ORF Transcript_115339/g.229903 Transcript_115339/m.229903 type:complete len:350 (-) Transcript_115339:12-1061(-)